MSTGAVNPITPTGLSYLLSPTNVSSNVDVGPCDAVRIFASAANTTPAYVAIGQTNALVAAIPGASPANGIPLGPGQEILLGMGLNLQWVAGIMPSGSGSLVITPVYGTQH